MIEGQDVKRLVKTDGSSCGLLELPVAADQVVGRTVVLELRFGLALQFRNDALRQHLAELDAPLVERINVPDDALGEDAVLVEGDEFAQAFPA